ncbi:HDOD domain-containing protein [Algiphilus sp.]|uniref:HDOD domain-containing protein n=1 Tax=Algiphilus sp. TaxID=1872431 RepID=UPI003B523234
MKPLAAVVPSEDGPTTLAEWVTVLTEKELPVFARTVSNVSQVAGNPDASAGHLASAIMNDAAMAAKLLKIANSPVFSAGLEPIRTINRAVVVLGFDSVRKLAISLAIIENVLEGQSQESVMREMATAFHTASQAQGLAWSVLGPRNSDEVFVAGLLFQIGQLAFLGSSDARVDRYLIARAAMQDDPDALVRMEYRLLGVELKQLSRQLAEQWSLGNVLIKALSSPIDGPARMVTTGRQIAETVARHGWDAPATRRLLADTAKRLKLNAKALGEQVQQRAEAARQAAKDCGADRVAPFIPMASGTERVAPSSSATASATDADTERDIDEATAQPHADGEAAPGIDILQPDPAYQLDMLQKLVELRLDQPDLNSLMRTTLEGIHRGIGMDRTVFGLLTPRRDRVLAKHALGDTAASWKAAFHFALSPEINALLYDVVHDQEALWMHKAAPHALRARLGGGFADFCGDSDFMLQPVRIGDTPIGVLYADRHLSSRNIGEADFRSFRQFGKELLLGMRLLAR